MRLVRFLVAVVFVLHSVGAARAAGGEVNIYSSQQEHLIKPLLDAFTKETGIQVNLTTGDRDALMARLELEGEHSPADVLMIIDIGNIYAAKAKGLLQPVHSQVLSSHIPENLRDPEGYWYGDAVRARAIFYNKTLTDAKDLRSYEDLAKPEWRGKLLIRSSSNVYNQSLTAFMLAQHGEAKTLEWAKGIVANLARDPQGGDSDQLKALAAGEGAIAVANTYYYGRLTAGEPSVQSEEVKQKVGIILPNQDSGGAHVNIRGGGVTAWAKNKDNAVKLLEYLTTDKAQEFFAYHNFEYPAKSDIPQHPVVASWGDLKRHPINLEEIGKLQQKAIEIMDKAGWK